MNVRGIYYGNVQIKKEHQELYLEILSTVKARLYYWIKTNSVMLMNSSSLIGTTAVTSVLGFVYWLVAARLFPPQALGLASATISAMTLLGFFCTLGLGTLLMGELPRRPGEKGPLISASLILVGSVGGCLAIGFALIAPFVSADFQILRASVGDIALFAAGVSLSAITLVLDGAVVGLLRSELQLWRNALFAVVKLAALFVAGIWLLHVTGLTIYATWAIGNAFSLVILIGFVLSKGRGNGRAYLPQWRLLRRLGPAALEHHILNLILDVPTLAFPLLVTITLSATMNAWFYVSYMLAGFTYVIPFALSLVLFAMTSDQSSTLAHKARLTISLAFIAILLANCVLQLGAKQLLGMFGHIYVEQAIWSLRILALAAFPIIIKNHYIAISRIQRRMVHAILPIAIGTLLELGGAVLGGRLSGGISGLSLGWLIALCLESLFMSRTVYKAIRLGVTASAREQLTQNTLYHDRIRRTETRTNEPSFERDNPSDTLQCPHCNTFLPSWAVFCGSCGGQVEKGKNGERETRTENDEEQEADTVYVPSLSLWYLQRWQSSQSYKNTMIVKQTRITSPLPLEIEVSEQLVSSSSETATKSDYATRRSRL